MTISKFISLKQAVEIIPDGAHIAIGGFTIVRSPMAFIYELIRQKKKDLHLYGHSPGIAWDMLIGAGCVKRVEVAYESDGAFGNIGPMFRRAIQEKKIEWEDYSNFGMICRFMAGAMGLPFFPVKSQFGSDILNLAGFSEFLRKNDPKIAREKMHIIQCPFTEQKVILVPAINVDVSVIHVQQVSTEGTVRIYGQSFGDIQQALCAKKLIVTCEEVVEPEKLRNEPERNQIPFYRVDHIVHVPFGAHPCACSNYYDYDPVQFSIYHEKAGTDQGFEEYLNEFIYSVKEHQEYLSKIGDKKLLEIKADPTLGYRADLKGR
ncbi:MAG: CoA-transferase [Dehalococcoidales bacterium]